MKRTILAVIKIDNRELPVIFNNKLDMLIKVAEYKKVYGVLRFKVISLRLSDSIQINNTTIIKGKAA